MVIANTTAQRPAVAEGLHDSCVDAKVKQPVVGNQVFLALVVRLLVHAADACGKFPTVTEFVRHIA